MKRTPLKKVGSIGKANQKARQLIAEKAQELNLYTCEIKLNGCMGTFGIAPAHRHRRGWYQGDVEKLSDHNEWVASCQYCHQKIDADNDLLEETFKRLRG